MQVSQEGICGRNLNEMKATYENQFVQMEPPFPTLDFSSHQMV